MGSALLRMEGGIKPVERWAQISSPSFPLDQQKLGGHWGVTIMLLRRNLDFIQVQVIELYNCIAPQNLEAVLIHQIKQCKT
jgi:hypothetical protein